ncbi:MAG: transcription-repair coupling factor [Thermodesulfobacteriota bacterium]
MDNLARLKKAIRQALSPIEIEGATGAAAAYILAELRADIGHPCLVIMPSQQQAAAFFGDLDFFLDDQNHRSLPGANNLFFFPSYDISPLTGLSPPKELVTQRIEALYALSTLDNPVVVASLKALLTRVLPKEMLLSSVDLVTVNEEIDRNSFIRRLDAIGYFRTSLVEERGDFSVRGGVIDLYPPLYDLPVRIELWGDVVESIRLFEPSSQRSNTDLEELIVLPQSEVILNPSVVRRARSMGRLPGNLGEGQRFPGQEAWLEHFYSRLDAVFDYLPPEGRVCIIEAEHYAEKLREQLDALHAEKTNLCDEAMKDGKLFPQADLLFMSAEQLEQSVHSYPRIDFVNLHVNRSMNRAEVAVDFTALLRPSVEYHVADMHRKREPIAALAEKLIAWVEQGDQVILICRTEQQAERLQEILLNYRLQIKEILPEWAGTKKRKGLFICLGHLSHGFKLLERGLVVITEDEIFGEKVGARKKSYDRSRIQAIPWTGFSQLKPGDLVVHREHGIGQFEGLSKREIEGSTRDFVIIAYAHNDRLYLPADKVHVLQKYVGVDDENPQIDALGGRSWAMTKRKAKKAVERIAKDLVKLYAMRKFLKGFAFSKPDSYYREFEAGFEYEETPDQNTVIDEVLTDMESSRTMDRLICGDVGFGKTEVAMRAAFKAVADGKQVGVLVPTTVLAEQHYQTFLKRFSSYPVRIAVLSRFVSRTDQARIARESRAGTIDILIGTHRILSTDVDFKDLGLLIVDEEQRFGVKAKEKLKKLRQSVDVLAMTATPIPRTLHMSLLAVRDLSIIQSPPADRLSIQTYVSQYDEGIIRHAIERELDRGGQIFFVHNRVQTIDRMAERLKNIVPHARFGVAHGQMKERDLERAMMKFLDQEIDVLVCTTIIDSGLDIPSANTIIINHVDRFGLSEIYQLRGRVGRANVKAYAYLLVSNHAALTGDAQKRIKVLMDFSQLGSGVNIALHDLRIRGGGNILGFSQSGHIKAIGYELYLQLIEQAMAELKGEVWREEISPEITTDLPIFIPKVYIEESDVRLDLYKRLSAIKDKAELEEIEREVQDRFGPPPEEVTNLFAMIRIKIGLKRIGSTRLDITGSSMVFSFSKDTPLPPSRLVQNAIRQPEYVRFLSQQKLKVMGRQKDGIAVLKEAEELVDEFSCYVEGEPASA